jgi:hypothetical protein
MAHPITPQLRVAASAALLERGCVNVIGLEEIKSETGARWERLKLSIWGHLESLLRQRLGPTDFYVQLDDVSYVVCSPSVNQEEAQIFCLRIAHELHTAMLGPCECGQLRIARVISSADDLIEMTPVTGAELKLLAARARLERSMDEPTTPDRSECSATPNPQFLHKFVAIWDGPKEAITTHRCTSSADQEDAGLFGLKPGFKFSLQVTTSRIGHAAKVLANCLSSGQRFLLWIPISYEVMSSPVGRMEIASVCRSLSSDLRPYLIFEICDLPYGVPQSRLSELVGSLRPFCRGVIAQLPAQIANYGAYIGVGLQAIGLSLSAATGGVEMGSEIFKLGVAARKQHIMSFVLDVPNHELLRSARDLGINLISSPLIGLPSDAPASVKRLSITDISQLAA